MGGCQQLCFFPPPPGSLLPPPSTAKSPPPPPPPTHAPNFRLHCKHVEGTARRGPAGRASFWPLGVRELRPPDECPGECPARRHLVAPPWGRVGLDIPRTITTAPGGGGPHTLPRYRLPGRHTPRSLPGGSFKAPPPSVLNHHRGLGRLPLDRPTAAHPAPLPSTTLVPVDGPCAGAPLVC